MITLMTRDTVATFGTIGALVLCVGLGWALYASNDTVWPLVTALILGGSVLIIYIMATVAVKSDAGTESPLTAVCRGTLIGINSAANFGLLWLLLNNVSVSIALIVGTLVALINLLAGVGGVSHSGPYKNLLGWTNCLMPMSWLVTGLGLLFVLLSLLLHGLLTLPLGVEITRVGIQKGPLSGKSIQAEWSTGTVFVYGGLVANLNRLKTAFNMGNFAFVHSQSKASHILHESGHTLNLAAFGSLFHLIGAVDEVLGRHRAFAEFLADSNDPAGHTRLLMW